MFRHNILLLLVIICCAFHEIVLSADSVNQEKPKIEVITTFGWKFLTPANDSVISGLSHGDSQITLQCSAPYPIKFRVEGDQGEKFFRVGEGKTISNHKGELTYILETWKLFPKPSSMKIICVHHKNPLISSLISIFVTDGIKDFVPVESNTKYPLGKLIQCPTSNPELQVQLFKEVLTSDGKTREIPINVTYDHTLGFIFNDVQKGRFICQTAKERIKVDLQDPFRSTGGTICNDPNTVNFEFFLDSAEQTQIWLTSDMVYLICNTTTGEITTHVQKQSDNQKQIIPPGGNSKLNKVVVLNGTNQSNSSFGSFVCKSNSGLRTNIVKYLFLESPQMIFNTRNSEIDCVSTAGNKSISSLRCINPNDCFLFKECLDSSKCRSSSQDFFAGEPKEGQCFYTDDDDEVGKPCISIRNTFENGLIECGLANRAIAINFEFFTGLKRVKYHSWKDAPVEELIRLDEKPSVLHANISTYFFCEAVGYLFVDTFHYFLSFKNGSTIFLAPGITSQKKYVIDNSKKTAQRKIKDFNVVSGININLPVEATELTCQAAMLEEPVKLNASRKFTVKYLQKPSIDRSNGKVSLTRGYEGRLVCRAEGEPLPYMRWYFKNEAIEQVQRTTNGEGILEFPKVDDSVAGEYSCTAANRIGNDTVTFNVAVSEPVETTLYLIIFGTVVVICALFLIAFYFWRQHKFAKELLRQLTDEEIDEFLNGNRDMWVLNLNSNKQENINYMPYNKDYEIPILSLDLDETSLLGSGEYGMIMKATYDSSTVAVKTTKPAADVLYFKALLAELKVMIFIGEQENIVKLIGAVTENIKDRKLYIVFELCALGNLESYLRDNKGSYVNGNGDQGTNDDKNNADYMNKIITQDDFMKWSYEVASAMEWLANKKVIHADLATRNILLTETRTAKLSDFGLSLKLYQDNQYVKRKQVPLPFRWMAIESLKQLQFSTETDIWSYGVTVWEIFTLGDTPFPEEIWNNDYVDRLMKGTRLDRPLRCPALLYKDVLLKCWALNPSDRPSFTVIKNHFKKMVNPKDVSEERVKSKLEMGTVMYSNEPTGIENANYSNVSEEPDTTPRYTVMEE